jgi:hypothetical protein
VAGATMRCRRQTGDSNRVSAANTARSAQDSRGLLTWRRNTVTECRSTRISAFLDCALRASSPSQAMTCRKIRYSSRNDTAHDHAQTAEHTDHAGQKDRPTFGTPQVTPSLPIRLDRTTAASLSRPLERSKTTSLRLTLRARAGVGGEPFVVVIDP